MVISAAHLNPVLTGQSKELLDNEDMVPFCEGVVLQGLDEWSKSNPQDLARLSKFFKEMAELRMKNESGKAKIASNYKKNAIYAQDVNFEDLFEPLEVIISIL